jgi:hypothetical protein
MRIGCEGTGAGIAAGGVLDATGEFEEGVEGVGLAVLVAAGPAGRGEDVVDDRRADSR